MDEKILNKALAKAFTKQDARFETKLLKALENQETRLKGYMDQVLTEQARDYRDFTHQEIKASENRLISRMDDSESRILLAVAETHDAFVLPRLHNVEKRLLKLEAKIA